jgi:hypothetical protein
MFYIRNCNGHIVGNPKGYRTHRGAQAQCERKGKIRESIYTAWAEKPRTNDETRNLVYSIKWEN